MKPTVSFRNMNGEAECEEGFIAVYEVSFDGEPFGTIDRARQGQDRHKLQSWCGEHTWYFGYSVSQWGKRIQTWASKNL